MPRTSASARPRPRPRRRLGVDERREQLLALGMELFSTRAYEDIRIDEIADRAGVSRGLLYHYFPTKRDFYVAVTRLASTEVAALTAPDPSLPPLAQLRAGVDAFLQAAERRSHGFLTAYRGSLAADPEVRAILEESRERQAAAVLGAVAGPGEHAWLLRTAVRGWIALAQEVTARWLEQDARTDRAEVCDMLVGALLGAVQAAGQRPPDPGPAS